MESCNKKITNWNRTGRTVAISKCKITTAKCVGEQECEMFQKEKKAFEKQLKEDKK